MRKCADVRIKRGCHFDVRGIYSMLLLTDALYISTTLINRKKIPHFHILYLHIKN